MYYLKIKCGVDPYELDDDLEFYFNSIEETIDFAKHILRISNYEVKIGNYYDGEDNEK